MRQPRRDLNLYYVEITLAQHDKHGNRIKRVTKQRSTCPGWAMRNVIDNLLPDGIDQLHALRIVGEPISVQDLNRAKNLLDKSKVFKPIYDGVSLISYEHKDSGLRITPEEYRNLEELIVPAEHKGE